MRGQDDGVLTVKIANRGARRFYGKRGYWVDESSPQPSEKKDYMILSRASVCLAQARLSCRLREPSGARRALLGRLLGGLPSPAALRERRRRRAASRMSPRTSSWTCEGAEARCGYACHVW